MRKKLEEWRYLGIILFIFVLAVMFINPFGNYAVNDDWDFFTHVRNFRNGDFIKNQLIDSAFVLQGLLAALWSYIFGFTYNSLRILTIFVTIVFVIGLYKLLAQLEINKNIIVMAVLSVLFNPFVLMSSITFMTEVYFLCLVVWGIYFLFRHIDSKNNNHFILSVVLTSMSLLVRQIGFLVVPIVLLGSFINDYKNNRIIWKKYLYGTSIFILFSLILFWWPQYSSTSSKSVSFLINTIHSLKGTLNIFVMLFYTLPYIGFILIPLTINNFLKAGWKIKLVIITLSLLFLQCFYKIDIFKFGNVFYPEALMVKNNYVHTLSIFNNIAFKIILTMVCNISLFTALSSLIKNRSNFKNIKTQILLILTCSLLFPVLIYEGFFDRYLINGLMTLVLLFVYITKNDVDYKALKISYIITSIYCIYSLFLVQDFITTTRIQWQYAEKLSYIKNIENRLFLSTSYTKYKYVFSKNNSKELTEAMPAGISYQCYVQKKVYLNPNNLVYKTLNRIETSRTVNKFFKNPGPYENKLLPGYRPPTNDPKKILFTKPYISVPDYLIGSRSEIITYCID